ncbi:MAG: helix-turn-helix domain-containing protein [Streptosporangiaceae bacterium]
MTINGTDFLAPDLATLLASNSRARPRRRVFTGHPAQVACARQFVRRALAASPAADDAALLTSELAANAIRHTASGSTTFEVVICHRPATARIAIIDAGAPTVPAPASPGCFRPGTRTRRSPRPPMGPAGKPPRPRGLVRNRLPVNHPAPTPVSPSAHRWNTPLDGQGLRQLRHQHHLSQEKLATKAGISPATVAGLERTPRTTCRTRTLGRLATALGEQPAALTPSRPG